MELRFLVLVVAVFLSLPARAADEKKPPMVMVSPAKRAELFEVLTYPARVVPKVNANVLSESEGVVTKIHAPLGSRVVRGQKLLTVKHTDPVYQYAPVNITAPVTGVVSLVDVSEGSLIAKGQRVATVTDPNQIRVSVEIAAADLAAIRAGLTGELKLPGLTDPVAVRVRGVSPFVDPATGTASCELETTTAPNTTSPIAPGIVGQVLFKVNNHQGFSLPDHAIVYKGGETFVRVVENDKAKYMPVKLGRRSRGLVEIATGLQEGAKVIERASAYISEGEKVTVEEKKL